MRFPRVAYLLLPLAGVLLLLWAVAVSPVVIAWLFTSDNHIGSATARLVLWTASGSLLLATIALWRLSRTSWRPLVLGASILILVASPVLAWFYWQANPNRHHWHAAITAEEALTRMKVPSGFSVELIAAEPDLVNPVALAFDDRGRAWVSESVEYPRISPGKGKDCIKILNDADGDGRTDKVTVFADDLNMPTGLAIGYGGVWVLNAPDLLFMQDTDGDDIADKRKVVLTGFGRNDPHELPSSLNWGPDGWLYGLNGISNPSKIKHQGQTFEFSCAMYRYHPRTDQFQIFCEGTSNPWGLAWNTEGSAFVSSCVIDHLWHFSEGVYYKNQSGHYPPNCWPAPSIVKHQHQSAAYCGLEFYDSDAYPSQYRNRLYMGNLHGGCLNVDLPEQSGATYFAQPEADFLTAHDGWFMPVSIKTGPDGCLHVLDWYDRYHCHQDAERDPEGIDRLRGRLYRIRYEDSPRSNSRDLALETDAQLVTLLADGNAYLRRKALRLLQERLSAAQALPIRQKLESLTFDSTATQRTRLHALWALIGGGELQEEFHLRLLAQEDSSLCAWGVRAAGDAGQLSAKLLSRIENLAAVPNPIVQAQVLVALRKIDALDKMQNILSVLEHSPADPLLPHLAWQALKPLLPEEETAFRIGVEQTELSQAENLAALLPHAMKLLLENTDQAEDTAALLLSFMNRESPTKADTQIILNGLKQLAEQVQSGALSTESLASLKVELEPALQTIRQRGSEDSLYLPACLLAASWGDETALAIVCSLWENPANDAVVRVSALQSLVSGGQSDIVFMIVSAWPQLPATETEFRSQVIDALSRVDSPTVGEFLISEFDSFSPAEQAQVIDLLTSRSDWAEMFLDAIKAETIPDRLVNLEQVRKLQQLPNPSLVERAKKRWGVVRQQRNSDRAEVVARMKKLLAELEGDSSRGQQVFARSCSQCHKLYGQGHVLGPDLTSNGRASIDQLLSNVFDPNLVIGSAYKNRMIATDDGRVFTGLLAEETDKQIVLKLPGGKKEVIQKDSIEELIEPNISLMPEGFERQLKPQELADLFAYLLQQPGGPPQ